MLHQHWGNRDIAPVLAQLSWIISVTSTSNKLENKAILPQADPNNTSQARGWQHFNNPSSYMSWYLEMSWK